jgi:hypothetical protein
MINYRVDIKKLTDEISRLAPNNNARWWKKAFKQYVASCKSKKHDKTKEYWSDIKSAYINLQFSKCIYCEKPLAIGKGENIDYDMEHYRPKGHVEQWPAALVLKRMGLRKAIVSGRTRGYPELAHHPMNYAASCKVCNSPNKQDYFPIAGLPSAHEIDIKKLNAWEKPLIPLPLGDWGDDPEQILDYEGFICMPKQGTAPSTIRRAKIIIDVFELNLRPDLLLGRATKVGRVYECLEECRAPNLATDAVQANRWLNTELGDASSFAATARALVREYRRDRASARRLAILAKDYAVTHEAALRGRLL